jgi:hypothetical protein
MDATPALETELWAVRDRGFEIIITPIVELAWTRIVVRSWFCTLEFDESKKAEPAVMVPKSLAIEARPSPEFWWNSNLVHLLKR